MELITLATLKDATAQEVFTQMATHLLTQKEKSRIKDEDDGSLLKCVYKNDTGLKCAAGCLISDEEYDKELFEHKSWSTLVSESTVSSNHHILISDVQYIHDSEYVEDWKHKLSDIADLYELEMP